MDTPANASRSTAPPPAPDWLDELSLSPGPPWLSMGVRPLELDRWLVVDERCEAELALKRELLRQRPGEVFAALGDTDAASGEVLELVVAWLAEHHPERPRRVDPGRHPLDAAGRLVQEDLCLMVPSGPDHVLGAASLCFPSHWRLADKLGRPVADVHAPVPHYREELAAKVDRFFDRLRPERPVVRRNLSIHAHDDLFRPEPHESPEAFPADATGVDRVWLRSERQTLRRLPRHEAVLFTIKTQQCAARALTHRPELARALSARLRADRRDRATRGEAPPFPLWLPDWLDRR